MSCDCGNCTCSTNEIKETDNMGREMFWLDLGRKDD